MSERDNFSSEPYQLDDATERLRQDLIGEDMSYFEVLFSLVDYLENELELDQQAATKLVSAMRQDKMLPSETDYDDNRKDAITKMKIGILSEVVAWQEHMTTDPEEFYKWLQDVMGVIVEGHTPKLGHNCFADSDCDASHCSQGLCPAKIALGMVSDRLSNVHVDEADYRDMPEKRIAASVAHLDALYAWYVIDEHERNQLAFGYERKLLEEFPWMDKRTTKVLQ